VKIEEAKELRRNIEMTEFASPTSQSFNVPHCRVSYQRFDKALRILGIRCPNYVTARYQLEDIEAAYEGHLDVLTLERTSTETQGDD
jgi:hypothetical protein